MCKATVQRYNFWCHSQQVDFFLQYCCCCCFQFVYFVLVLLLSLVCLLLLLFSLFVLYLFCCCLQFVRCCCCFQFVCFVLVLLLSQFVLLVLLLSLVCLLLFLFLAFQFCNQFICLFFLHLLLVVDHPVSCLLHLYIPVAVNGSLIISRSFQVLGDSHLSPHTNVQAVGSPMTFSHLTHQ